MARGEHPNSRKNLVQNQGLSREEVENINRKGGVKSGEVRREFKDIQECFKEQMDDKKRIALFDRLFSMAMRGNLKAVELLVRYLGEEPPQKVEQVNTDYIIDFGDIEGDG